MDPKEIIKQFASKTTYTEEELTQMYEKAVLAEKKEHPDEASEVVVNNALASLRLRLKREFLGGTSTIRAFIIAAEGLKDFTGRRYSNAVTLYEKDPEQAVTQGFTDEAGIPLYSKQDKWRGGQPLPEHEFQRTIYASGAMTRYTITLRGAAAKDFDYTLVGKLVEMPVWINKEKSTPDMTLASFTKRLEAIRVQAATPEDGQPISVTEVFQKVTTKSDFLQLAGKYKPIVITGVVIESKEGSGNQSSIVSIEPEFSDAEFEDAITCWIDSKIPIDFADGSELILVGTPGVKSDDKGNGKLHMSVTSVIPTAKTIKAQPKPIVDDSSEEPAYEF
jgi:hypothetical protein